MIFWIAAICLIAGIVWRVVDEYSEGGLTLCSVSSLIMVIMLFILLLTYVCVDGDIARYNARYEMLTYQLENDIYDNDNDLGKRDLMEDIQDWNETLAFRKEAQDDFWIGIFIPNIYDQFEFIELETP